MINVLFFASSPINTQLIRFDRESRQIRNSLSKSHLNLHLRIDAHLEDLVPSITEIEPTIVHFSCHGSPNGMYLTSENGTAKLINPLVLGNIIKRICPKVKIIVLNTCFSQSYADAIASAIDNVVFFPSSLGDEEAIIFSREFYRALAINKSVRDAYDIAVDTLKSHGCKVVHQIIIRN